MQQEEDIVDEFVVQQSSSTKTVKRRRGESSISRRTFTLHLLNVPGSHLIYSFVDVSVGDITKVLALDIEHVLVPEASRGCKVAERLVRRAFAMAVEHAVPIIPTCTYVSNTFLSRYHEMRSNTMTLDEVLASSSVTKEETKVVKKRRKRKPW